MNRTETDIFFEELPIPALFFDPSTLKIRAVNNAAIALHGYSRDEMLSLTIKDLRLKGEVPKLIKYLDQDFKKNSNPGVWRHLTKNKKSIYVDISCSNIQVNGKDLVLTTLNEVTNLKQIESRFKESLALQKLLKKELPGVFFIFNSRAKLSHWNNNVEAIMGYTTDEISEMEVTDFLPSSNKRKFI